MMKRSLRQRREALRLTQAVLAGRAGIKANDVSMVETGRNRAGCRTRRVRRALIEAELTNRRWRRENARIERQRAVWNDIPDGLGKEQLIELLSDAAWRLLDGGQCEEADLILFILPDAVTTKLLDDFFGE